MNYSGGSNGAPASQMPLFLGYFEETHYGSPHYQSIVPFKSNAILEFIVANGGYCAQEYQSTDLTGNVLTVYVLEYL